MDFTKLEKFKMYLAEQMAEIDAMNFQDKTYDEHFESLMQMRDFELLAYWLKYNGVFDGGEDMLTQLKTII